MTNMLPRDPSHQAAPKGRQLPKTVHCRLCHAELDYLPYDGVDTPDGLYFNCHCGTTHLVRESK